MKDIHSKATRPLNLPGLYLISALLLCMGCANPIPPTGGPKDTTPPKLIVEESTPNFLTQFNEREIMLTFDEWIQLKDQNLQIVISPPLAHRPEITLKGKTVIVKWHEQEVLRDQTTYLINFGSSIADITEGNILDQYKFIFSTGTFIDSLSVRGTVLLASTGEPAKQTLIILHDDLSDTAISKLLPAYFTKANDAGQWSIENVRSDTFNVFALTDLNLNYRYDQVGEKIGFLGQSIFLPDSTETRYRITLFEEDPVLSVLDVNRRYAGITRIVLSGQSKSIAIQALDTTRTSLQWRVEKDTAFVWNATQDSFDVIVMGGSRILDSVLIRSYQGRTVERNVYSPGNRFLHPVQPLTINSKVPLQTFDTTRIICYLSDSIRVDRISVSIDSADKRRLSIRHAWREQERYRALLLPGAITDIFGAVNDTLQFPFQISPINSFGQIFAHISGLNDSMQYIVELVHPQSGVVGTSVIRNTPATKLTFDKLAPQPYQIRIIEDVNENGRWDTGNIAQLKQPERVFIQSLEPLRAGWDLEATLVWEQK